MTILKAVGVLTIWLAVLVLLLISLAAVAGLVCLTFLAIVGG